MSFSEMYNNMVTLCGRIAKEPTFSHEIMGEGFYDTELIVQRLSGQDDVVPLTVSERLMQDGNFEIGNLISVNGQLRSYNKLVGDKSKLVLKVFVREVLHADTSTPNKIEMSGYICKPPIYRTTPFGREIADLLIAVNRAYNKSDYIPAIAWGRNARYASSFAVGDKIFVEGRIQSRVYQKQLDDGSVEDRTAYEVSVSKLEKLAEDTNN